MKKTDNISLDLVIGVTRQCNFSCGHCLRGDAEKEAFDVQTLKTFFEKNPDIEIDNLTLTGGEPFMRVDILNEILDCFQEYGKNIDTYFIATNGSYFNKESIEFIFRLHDYVDIDLLSESFIKISNSPYHQEEAIRLGKYIINNSFDLEQTMYEEEYDFDLEDFTFNTYGFTFEELNIQKEEPHYGSLINEGRAAENGIGRRGASSASEYEEDYVRLLLYLNEVGNVIPDYCDLSFDSQDLGDTISVADFSVIEYVEEMLEVGECLTV